MSDEEKNNEWPLSNYPILLALILLVSTALALGFGKNEAVANQLATYAYFLLVIGVAIRFFELTLPESLVQRIKAKIPKAKVSEDMLISKKEINPAFLADVARNVFFSLLFFFLIALAYGAIAGWFLVEGFIEPLGYIVIVFLVLHLALRYGIRS